ncbi:L-threonylcarbamoyladenylate synthase [Sphingomonas sp. BN140010]|uniref:Threonylcarbamoyl-AMP synthase n=1 Tax=Sphingomonas arvum TaxID=2992113 RepID=A0ABT3JEX7_9SPHN|nr:L-threonylcarbamoyladenylate synthase [Sphingomonas sp. BN140010]MCW3797564.1 L-threonylcarbamoyladenylate synthase [Sphingomonas sp. BN140010]
MTVQDTAVRPFDEATLAEAAALILAGQPVAVPTETVYGLAADATNGEAVARIYAAKGRPSFNPLIVHVPDFAAAEALGAFDERARELAQRHWPGPLTLVVPLRAGAPVAPLVTAGLPTVALRVPAHPVMQALLRTTGRPLAAPSANASGRISPTRAEHVLASLGGRVPLILDGGATERGLESTIVAVGRGGLRLLRPGPVQVPDAEQVTGGPVHAPGMLASHYAPTKPVRLNATERQAGEWLIGFGPIAGDDTLSAAGSLEEAAANLFAALHHADAQPVDAIAVASVPDHELGRAINDRLRRAAADKE